MLWEEEMNRTGNSPLLVSLNISTIPHPEEYCMLTMLTCFKIKLISLYWMFYHCHP